MGVPALRRLIAIALAAVLAAAVLAAPAAAHPNMSVTFEAPRDLLDPATRDSALAELDTLGVRSLRIVLYWKDVAPDPNGGRPQLDGTDPANYDWSKYDPLIAAANARGWPVLLTVSGPVPRWATRAGRDFVTRPSPARFQAFMTAAGRHYGGKVATWSIWNEPNLPRFLRPQFANGGRPASPELYRKLYDAGRARAHRGRARRRPDALRRARPRAGPAASSRRSRSCAGCSAWTRTTRSAARAAASCDTTGMAHHAYTTREGPWFVPSGPNDVTIGVLGRLTKALDRAANAGAVPRGLPIWLTEFGIQSFPDDIQGVPLARQPEYQAISERIARSNDRVASFSQYLLRDDPPTGPDQLRRVRVRAAARRREGEAVARRVAAAARGAARGVQGVDLGPGAAGDRAGDRRAADPAGLGCLADAAERHHRRPRIVHAASVVPQRPALAPALDGARRDGPHRLADSRVRPRVEAGAWQPSSGCFATAKPNRTTRDRTPTGG